MNRPLKFFIIWVLVSLACAPLNLVRGAVDSAQPANRQDAGPLTFDGPDYESGGPAAPTGLAANPEDALSIRLTWQPAAGAERYLLERAGSDGVFIALVELPPEAATYRDYLAPQGEPLTYHLRSVAGNQAGEPATATAQLEAIPANPLIVEAVPFSSGFDPSNPAAALPGVLSQFQSLLEGGADPSSLDPSQLSAMLGGQGQPGVKVGPAGGTLSAETPDGSVHYQLDVPEGALPYEVEMDLVPLQEVKGLPFSGGLLAGVDIQPNGLSFSLPATLSIRYKEAPQTGSLLPLAFAIDPDTSELYLRTIDEGDAISGRPGSPGLARLPDALHLKSGFKMITVNQAGPAGISAATPAEVNSQVGRGSSNPANNGQQNSAAAELNDEIDLIPLPNVKFNKNPAVEWAKNLEMEMAGAGSMGEISTSLDSFSKWLDQANRERMKDGEPNKYIGMEEKLWELAADNIIIELNLLSDRCREGSNPPDTGDVMDAWNLLDRMGAAKKGFYKDLADQLRKQYDEEEIVKHLRQVLERCKPAFEVPAQQWGDVILSGQVCLGRPFTLNIGGMANGWMDFVPGGKKGGTLNYYVDINGGGIAYGNGRWTVTANQDGGSMTVCQTGRTDVMGYGAWGSNCTTLDLIPSKTVCP